MYKRQLDRRSSTCSQKIAAHNVIPADKHVQYFVREMGADFAPPPGRILLERLAAVAFVCCNPSTSGTKPHPMRGLTFERKCRQIPPTTLHWSRAATARHWQHSLSRENVQAPLPENVPRHLRVRFFRSVQTLSPDSTGQVVGNIKYEPKFHH